MVLVGIFLVNLASAANWWESSNLSTNLEYVWQMQEGAGTNLEEMTAGLLNMTADFSSWITSGNGNNAVFLNGSYYAKTVNTDNSYDMSSGEKTWCFYANLTNATTYHLFGKDRYTGASGEWRMVIYRNNWQFHERDGSDPIVLSNWGEYADEWHAYCLRFHPTKIEFFIDGEYYQNGTWEQSNVYATEDLSFGIGATDESGTRFQYARGGISDLGLWSRHLSPTEIEEYSDEVNPSSLTSISTTLLEPEDNARLSENGTYFNVSVTAINLNITNVSYYIWNSSSIFNITTIQLSGTSNSTKIFIDDFELGAYTWNALGCGENATGSICSFADSNYSFSIGASLTSLDYNSHTFETAAETFTAKFNIIEDAEISLAQLVYDNTNYTISNITYLNSTKIVLTKTIDVPLNSENQNTTNNFYFRFVYAGNQIQETSEYQQNVSYIILQRCNSTYPTTAVNFTYRDEFTDEEINASSNKTSMEVTFNYWLGSGTIYKNYSFQNLSMTDNQVKFCIYPSDINLKVNMDMDYEVMDYSPRQYFFRNATLTNNTREINLINLLIDYSVKFFVDIKQGIDVIDNAVVTIDKYYSGSGDYKTISVRKTDDEGEFIEYFDIDKTYRFNIIKNGELIGIIEKWITCQEAPCILSLQVEEEGIDYWQGYYDYFATDVSYDLSYDDSLKIVTFSFTDLTGLAQYFRLEVLKIKYNESSAVICNKTLYSTSGTLTCNVTGYDGQFIANSYVSRSPEKFVKYIKFAIQTIKDVLGSTGILITLFLIITIALVGAWNPAVGVILTAFSILVMTFLGFTAFSWATITLVFVLAIIIIMKMRN
ncbi:MAG: LamG-like jellyroll fold domain-containing protein [Candidatus Hodarchaeales archaeon]